MVSLGEDIWQRVLLELVLSSAGAKHFNTLVLGKHPFLLSVMACPIRPRMLVTLDEDLKPLPVSVRVGQAVETVGQAGKPKTITGF